VGADEGVVGWMPRTEDFDLQGLDGFGPVEFNRVQSVNEDEWRAELLQHEELLMRLHATVPKEFIFTRQLAITRV
jgi:phosphoenolpyruvate carboxykinase (GTP)